MCKNLKKLLPGNSDTMLSEVMFNDTMNAEDHILPNKYHFFVNSEEILIDKENYTSTIIAQLFTMTELKN